MKFPHETLQELLDSLYAHVLRGAPGSESVHELAASYLKDNYHSPSLAAESLIRWQTAKCGVSGFFSGIGGALTLPVAVPADLAATWYVQMRMAAAIAHLYGHDLSSDRVRTFVYMSLIGDEVKEALKRFGIKLGMRITKKAMNALSREIFRKLGERGAINLVKVVPLAGGVIGAGVNTYYCLKVGEVALALFANELDEGRAA